MPISDIEVASLSFVTRVLTIVTVPRGEVFEFFLARKHSRLVKLWLASRARRLPTTPEVPPVEAEC
jgi:hypothetical protein